MRAEIVAVFLAAMVAAFERGNELARHRVVPSSWLCASVGWWVVSGCLPDVPGNNWALQ